MARKRKVSGAALAKRIEKQLREELAEFGLPMSEYSCEITNLRDDPGYAFDPDLILFAKFTRGNREIRVHEIFHDDNGEITQFTAPEMR